MALVASVPGDRSLHLIETELRLSQPQIRVKLLADEKDDEERERSRARIAGDIHDTIRGVKQMIRELLPPELDRQGLSSGLGSVFRDIEDVYGLRSTPSLIA